MINTIKNDLWLFIKTCIKQEYPDYVLKNKLTDEIPVFIYHHITSDEFEERLDYLKRNDYNTLTADQLEQGLNDRASVPERSVVLSFDDGLTDVYDVAYPLLKKHKFKAVVFLIPNWMGKPGVLTWDQVKEMHDNGVIDFQSHSMNHPAIFTSSKLIDFYRPRLLNLKLWNIPLINTENGDETLIPPSWGTPLYQYSSRFSDAKRYYPDFRIQQLCVEHVNRNGSEEFFKRNKWRYELKSIIDDYKRNHSEKSTFESQNMQINSILKELQLSKCTIEHQLTNKIVRHFAYPWNQTGILTTKLLVDSGYKIAFTGLMNDNLTDEKVKNIHLIRRVTGDFIKCLPGEGRQSFWSVLIFKIFRRFKVGTTY